MRAVCPNNPEHDRFRTVAHVMEDWIVDEKGSFLENLGCLQVDHGPDAGNNWTCMECEEEAEVTA